jgi:hypothetical protein
MPMGKRKDTTHDRSLTDLYRDLSKAGDAWWGANYPAAEGKTYIEARDQFWQRMDAVADRYTAGGK